ncbi:hypothetical protein CIL05_20050 [Virgibacillus profundi]|uniref:Uncharacterized protein n=1 Tax=Virgibacillus profundi TaxID=2024555 RepID=A0A2A2I9V8_9BACI|nr:hypothetical protein [Virgibacillus profundi]PAV27843.1 hypothetical protein CIL05_20050 [Virgibacillus profundi]PXY51970.1 hypothetical protein CIT14_20415 [Virgibacillus profundi]
MKKEVTFKESRIIGTTILLIGMGFLMSFVPEGNVLLLLFNSILALVSCLLFYLFWKKTRHNSKRYFSLLSYVMVNTLSIYFAIPLLRIYFLTITFWIGIIMLIVMVILPYLYSREIAFGVQKPSKSKLGRIYFVFAILIIAFGSTVFMGSLYTSNPDAIVFAVLGFVMALLFLFISPVFLIKPKEMNEITNT